MWEIFGLQLAPGQKEQTFVNIAYKEEYKVPVTVVNGAEPGKTVVITAGIHAMEYPGTAAVNRLAQEIQPEEVKGRILLFHCVNLSGFRGRSILCVPEDDGNLNGCYPGDANGSLSRQIAAWFEANVFSIADFVLDLHSGLPGEALEPCVFFPHAPAVRDVSFAAAKGLDVRYVIESTAQHGEYSYAANFCGVPGMLLERGCGGNALPEWIDADIADLKRVLNHFGATGFAVAASTKQKYLYTKMDEMLGDCEGIWYPAVREGETYRKGQLLGRVEDFFGNVVKEYYAEEDGTVFYYTAGLPMGEYHLLIAYGNECDRVEL